MTEQKFKVGDKVTHTFNGDGEIVLGPVDGDRYLMRPDEGTHEVVTARFLKLRQKFKVGDKVTSRYTGSTLMTVVAGPFATEYGGPAWVVADEDGDHRFPDEDEMALAPADRSRPFKVGDVVRVLVDGAESASVKEGDIFRVDALDGPGVVRVDDNSCGNWWFQRKSVEHATHTEDGVTYDLSSKYKDRRGNVWSFTARENASGEPFVTMSNTLTNTDTIVYIAASYGPLTRV